MMMMTTIYDDDDEDDDYLSIYQRTLVNTCVLPPITCFNLSNVKQCGQHPHDHDHYRQVKKSKPRKAKSLNDCAENNILFVDVANSTGSHFSVTHMQTDIS